jgi:hypothetical protein
VCGVGALEHVVERLDVRVPSLAVSQVVAGELPALDRVVQAIGETLELFAAVDARSTFSTTAPSSTSIFSNALISS